MEAEMDYQREKESGEEAERMFEEFCKLAAEDFNRSEGIDPFIFILPAKGAYIPAIPIEDDKEAVSRLVQSFCAEVQAIVGIIVSEGWIAKPDGITRDRVPPSKRLDRQKVLQVVYVSRSKQLIKLWEILRDGKKKWLEEIDTPGMNRLKIRFFGDYFGTEAYA